MFDILWGHTDVRVSDSLCGINGHHNTVNIDGKNSMRVESREQANRV